jgi:hypothetical protein
MREAKSDLTILMYLLLFVIYILSVDKSRVGRQPCNGPDLSQQNIVISLQIESQKDMYPPSRSLKTYEQHSIAYLVLCIPTFSEWFGAKLCKKEVVQARLHGAASCQSQ